MAVRRESVRLELDDAGYSTGMAKAAAATLLLDRALEKLDGRQVKIRTSTDDASQGIDKFRRSADQSGPSIDRLSGRLSLLAQAAVVLGPSLIPIGAIAVPAITGLASSLGFAAIGMGSLVTATQGVGDALKAVNEVSIAPTAANLEKAREAMKKLGPEAQQFVLRFQELRPVLGDIRDAAAAGWFPGLTTAMDDFERVAPRVADIFQAVGEAGGRLVAEGAEALAGPEWGRFLTFVESEAPQALEELGHTVGNLARGLAELWMAFGPLNDDFSTWLLSASAAFEQWASGLAETEGFLEFVEYLQETGPQVGETLAAIARAVIAIIEAAAPLGGPVLEAFELIANTLEVIAGTSAGSKIITMAAAFVVLNKALAVTATLLARTGFAGASAKVGGVLGGRGGGTGAPGAGGPTPLPIASGTKSLLAGSKTLRADLKAARELRAIQMTAGARSERELARMRALEQQAARGRATMAGLAKTTAVAAGSTAAFAVASGQAGQSLGLQNTAMLGLVGLTFGGPVGAAIGTTVGLMIDLSKGADSAAESIDRLNSLSAAGASQNELQEGIRQARAELEDFAETANMSGGDYFKNWLGLDGIQGVKDNFTALKNGVEGVFGDSDVEEQQKAYDKAVKAAEKAMRTQKAFEEGQQRMAESTELRKWAQQTSSAFANLAVDMEKPETSLRKLMARMRDQGRAANDLGKNIRQAIRNGADPQALQKIIDDLGPAAGLALEQLARGGKKAARQLNESWKVSEHGLRRVEGAVLKLDERIARLPDGTVIRVTAEISKAQEMIERIKAQVAGIKDKTVRVNVFTNYLRGETLRAQGGRDGDPSTPYDGGGYTGAGGKYEPAGIVHRGEVVLPQEIVARDRTMLKDRYGDLPGMDQLYTGGLAGYASGGRVAALDFAGLPALNLTTMQLGQLNKALAASTKALSREKSQRDELISTSATLRDTVRDRFRTQLFGGDEWSSGGGIAGATAIANQDSSAAERLKKQIAQLKAKGLDGGALDALLSQGTVADIAAAANSSRSSLAAYERAFERRAVLTASVGSAASSAAYSAEIAATKAQTKALERRLRAIEQAVRQEHKEDRKSNRKGARSAARSNHRGRVRP